MAKPIVVMTGAAGFLGQNVVPHLIESGYDVVALDKHHENLAMLKRLNPSVKIVYADMSKKGQWMTAFDGASYLIVAHAQISSPKVEPFTQNNVTATQHVMSAAKTYGIKYVVHISSAAVNSVRLDDYARTKKESEVSIKASKIPYTILRPSMMYGVFDNKNVGYLISFARKFPVFPIPGTGKYPRQPVFVMDMARIIAALLKKRPANKTYNINGDRIDFIDMVKAILKGMKLRTVPVRIPIWLFVLALRTYNLILGRVEFTADQVKSLTSGDVFKDYPWWTQLKISKTSFSDGIAQIAASPHADLRVKR